MSTPYTPIQIDIDHEDSDEGFYSAGFTFNFDPQNPPNFLVLARDSIEEPGEVYIEADDQIHGFRTKNARCQFRGSVLTIELLDNNRFYWNQAQSIDIEIPPDRRDEIEGVLTAIFAIE